MITFVLLAVAFSLSGEEEFRRSLFGAVNMHHVRQGSNNYDGAMCFNNYHSGSKTGCEEGNECEWVKKCSEGCGYKALNRDCTGVTISLCKKMGYFESECMEYNCECDMTLQQCMKEGYSKEKCVKIGCADASETCKCDNRGVQVNKEHGDWCWLEKKTCTMLSGKEANDWEWARCVHEGKTQLKCSSDEQALAAVADVPYPEEEEVGTIHFVGCWGEKKHRCDRTPECDWKVHDCEYSCQYRDLEKDCSGITMSMCQSMGYSKASCWAYKCMCEWSLEECQKEGFGEAACKKHKCGDASQTCECDHRGVQTDAKGVDWCYLKQSPCTLLEGTEAKKDWTWADCVYQGKTQLDCKKGPKTCECNHRGVQNDPKKGGDFCYLKETPCTFLSGNDAGKGWTWANCVWDGKTQLDCKKGEEAVGRILSMECVLAGGHMTPKGCVGAYGQAGPILADTENTVLVTSSSRHFSSTDLAVYGFAAIGLSGLLYGAARHFFATKTTSVEFQEV